MDSFKIMYDHIKKENEAYYTWNQLESDKEIAKSLKLQFKISRNRPDRHMKSWNDLFPKTLNEYPLDITFPIGCKRDE